MFPQAIGHRTSRSWNLVDVAWRFRAWAGWWGPAERLVRL